MGIIKFLRLIKQALKRWVRKCQIKHHIFEISRKEKANYHALVSGVSFTDSEVKQLKALWKDYFPIVHNNYCRLYKSLNGFDARYIPNDLYGAVFVRVLNPYQYANVLVNKALCGVLFHDILRPLEPVRNIGGYFYDAYSQPKTVDESVKILLDFGKKLIVKPAVDSSCGKGVKILEYYGEEELRTVFSEYKSDFLFQIIFDKRCQK